MKIAVTSQGTSLDSPVDPQFGRCRYFVIVDDATGQVETVDNAANREALQGAGTQSARTLLDRGVQVVISGHVGPKAFSALQTGGAQIFQGASGSVREAIAAYKAGKLSAASRPDAGGRWR